MSKELRIRASAVVVANDCLLCFFAIDPTSGKEYFFLPGGKIENGESPEQAAIRETLEETSFRITIPTQNAIVAEYDFPWDGKWYLSRSHFFKAELAEPFRDPLPTEDVAYNKGALWLPLSEVESKFSYTKEILQAIWALVKV